MNGNNKYSETTTTSDNIFAHGILDGMLENRKELELEKENLKYILKDKIHSKCPSEISDVKSCFHLQNNRLEIISTDSKDSCLQKLDDLYSCQRKIQLVYERYEYKLQGYYKLTQHQLAECISQCEKEHSEDQESLKVSREQCLRMAQNNERYLLTLIHQTRKNLSKDLANL